jgi:hypothetical protein
MKAQLDNIEAILISDDASTCLPVIAHQAEIVQAAAQGTGKGALKAANPVNLAKGVYYTANGAYRALSFTLLQSARAQCYSELALSHPQLAQKFLDAFNADNKRVADTFSSSIAHMKESWDQMSGLERTEFIFDALTEAALTPKFQSLYIKGLGKTIGAADAIVGKQAVVKLTEQIRSALYSEHSDIGTKYGLDYKVLDTEIKKPLTNIERHFNNVGGHKVHMRTGHAYYRTHVGGDVSLLGELNEIEDAILTHCEELLGAIPQNEHITPSFTFNGHKVGYRIYNVGKFFSIDYFPLLEK